IAGIGKSTLVASWLVRQRPRPYIYWFEIDDGTTRPILLEDLAAFLARLGRRSLKNLLAEHRAADPQVITRVLSHDLREVPILVVLDNYQRATPDLVRFIAGPLLELVHAASTKVLLISRTRPASLMRRKVAKDSRGSVLHVHGLDLEASLSLLRAKGFAGDDVALQRAASSARGHPILLSFAAVYFMDGSEMRDRLEGMYHVIEAGDMKAFGEYLAETSSALLDSVPASELLTVLRKIDRTALDPLSACILPELMGDTFRAL